MLRINGIFSTGTEKETQGGTKYLSLCNTDKDQQGNINKSYYTMWLNDKAYDLIEPHIIEKLSDRGALVVIDGFLKVNKNGQYTNLTIIPKEIKEYSKH